MSGFPADFFDSPRIADGSIRASLIEHGLRPDQCASLLCVQEAELVRQISYAYVQAGAQILCANSVDANRIALKRFDAGDRVSEICTAAVKIARKAAGKAAVVVGVMGPCGKMLLLEEVTEDDLLEACAEQARALAAAGADAICCESISELKEMLVAVTAAKSETKLPVIASMSFGAGAEYTDTVMQTTALEAAQRLEAAGADLLGGNCGGGVKAYIEVVKLIRTATRLPIWVKPDNGAPELIDGRAVYPQTPDEFGVSVLALFNAGANVVGGCCGVTPEHIRVLRGLIEGRDRPRKPRLT